VTLLDQGQRVTHVARRIGCSHRSVVRWRDVVAEQGAAGLNAKPVPGCPAKLTERQRQRIPTLWVRGALAWGFRTDLWPTPRIAAVIRRTFGVRYHPTPVGRLLIDLGWSCQKPERRALERDEEAIAAWKAPTWRAITKKSAD
jgi:transposase